MEWLVTSTMTHQRPRWDRDGERKPHTRHFPPFVILDPGNLRSEDAVRHLAWRMIGEPGDFDIRIEERITPPYDEDDPVVDALMDLITLYKASPGHDIEFINKAQAALRSARDGERIQLPCEECRKLAEVKQAERQAYAEAIAQQQAPHGLLE